MSVCRIGERYEYFTTLEKEGVKYHVGSCHLTKHGLFARVSALWTETADWRTGYFVEYQVLQRPEVALPYHGSAGLELVLGDFRADRVSSLVQRIVIEDLATFRRRDPTAFAPDVFYICDHVDKESGVRYAEAPFRKMGTHALRVQHHVARAVTVGEVAALEQPAAVPPEAAAPVKEEEESKVRAFALVRRPDGKRGVVVATQRDAAVMPLALPAVEPARASKKRDVFVMDSDEEREEELVNKGIVAEKIDSEGSPVLKQTRLMMSSPAKRKTVPEGASKSNAVLIAKKAIKPLVLEGERAAKKGKTKEKKQKQAESPKPPKKAEPPKKTEMLKQRKIVAPKAAAKPLSEFDKKRQKKFAFLEDEDDEEGAWAMESYSSSSSDSFFVNDDGADAAVEMPAQFRTMTLKAAFNLWLEFVFFCEHDPLFRKRVNADPDNAYASAVVSIDKKIKTASEMLGSGGHWNAAARDKLCSWTKLQTRPTRAVEGRKCDLCGKTLNETMHLVQLHGQRYDGTTFWEKGILNVRMHAEPEEIFVGESCMQKATHFHRLNHFKIRSLEWMQELSDSLAKADPKLRGDANASKLVDKVMERCAERLLAEMTSLIEKAVSKELNIRL
jgi:hypothetical protein